MTIHQLHIFGHYPMPSTWQERLSGATTEAEVVSVARDYVAQFTPEEIGHLPEPCKPTKIVDGADVSEYALTLMRHHCDDGEGSTTPIHRLSAFFSNASVRLSEVLQNSDARQSA
jgi:hypothetical protein